MAIEMGDDQSRKNRNSKVKKERTEHTQLALSNRCVETSAQIQQVLQVIGLTTGALFGGRSHSMFDEGGVPKEQGKLTEGQVAVENTLRAACERMEKILNDDARWSDDFQRKIEKEYDDLHAQQMATIAAQRAAAAELTTPHFRYRPDLHRLRDGRWMAILGDTEKLEFAIYGIGESAQQAVEEFDCAFLKGVPLSVLQWADKREADIEAGRPAMTPFPNQEQIHEKNNDTEKLDDSGNSTSGSPSQGG